MEQGACIFCNIASKRIPAKIVYEDDFSMAFLDINPINPGHTLVISKTHSETILDVSPEILSNLMQTVKAIAEALARTLNPDGINVLQNNKEIAGQGVPHIHFHMIPRFKEDGVPYFFGTHVKKMEESELQEVADKIKSNIKVAPKPEKIEKKEEPEEEKPVERTEEEAYWIKRDTEIA